MTDMKNLKHRKLNATKISDMRVERGLTVEATAEGVGVDKSTISLWESGQAQPGPTNLKKLSLFFKVPIRALMLGMSVLAFASATLVSVPAHAMDRQEMVVHMTPYWNQVVDAIYMAEGGERAKKPFGILSVPCSDYGDCRKVCFNTVRNNYFRWIDAGRPGEYLEFLAKRYAPVGAENDPSGLNRNWLKNVSALVEAS